MSYAEETSPESDIPAYTWKRPTYAEFEYNGSDKRRSTLIENATHTDEEVEEAVHRLAQISAVVGDVRARVSLAVFGGLDIQEGEFFRTIVDNPVEGRFDFQAEIRVLRMARAHRNSGDDLRFTALSAVVGLYPPEYGDAIKDPADTLTPYYDSRMDFRAGPDTHLINELGNRG
jgi:hypothetical protein